MSKKEFLRANWLRLASANYVVDPSILTPYLPVGTELEDHNDKYYISLVAFRYSETQLLKVKVPFHKTFEEINLRFYVKREIAKGVWRSEVAFTRLFFPKKSLSFVARRIYKENYETVKMNHEWSENEKHLITSYGLKKDKWYNFKLETEKESTPAHTDSEFAFFNKHYWGTSSIDSKKCTVYEIEHQEWNNFNVVNWHIDFDFGLIFGEEFSHLNTMLPESVLLTDGSPVIVKRKEILFA
jgi:uncharacterized protein YqjF (DUF2071 family)